MIDIIPVFQKTNLTQLVFEKARQRPEKTALLENDTSISYHTLACHISHAARQIQAQSSLQPGDCVGLLMYNTTGFVIVYFALLALGLTVIPLNTRLVGNEIQTILEDADARWLITHSDFEAVVSEFNHWQGQIVDEVALLGSMDCSRTTNWITPATVNEKTLATLIYTSGTTGKPKGVMLSHHNILVDADANRQVIEAQADDVFITISPLFHVFGQTNILITALMAGASIVLVKKFSPKSVLEAIETHRVTFMAAVPTMYQMMLSQLRERTYDLSSLRVCHSGAAPMAETVFHEVERVFGAPVQEGYGQSEASSIITSNPLHGVRKPGSVGLPLPGIEVCVVDETTLQPVPPHTIGELLAKGETVMQGYWKRPEASAKVLLADGWLRTGDMAYLDTDGYVHIVDRRDDLMNVGGVKVYPREVEEVLYKHPAVQAVAVVGIASELYHHIIKAYVVLRPAVKCTVKDLQTHCRESLAAYKIPQYIEFVGEIPQGATGKILRKELRT